MEIVDGEDDEVTGQLPLESGFEPSGHVVCAFDGDEVDARR